MIEAGTWVRIKSLNFIGCVMGFNKKFHYYLVTAHKGHETVIPRHYVKPYDLEEVDIKNYPELLI